MGHLVIEKLIKGIYAKNNQDNPKAPKSHDLLFLAKKCELELNDDKRAKLDLITSFNMSARYEDHKRAFYNKCTKEYTEGQIKNIEEMRAWLKGQLI